MKKWKTLGAVAAATALSAMALTPTASGTTITGPGGETTPTIHVVNEGGHIEMHNSIVNIACDVTLEGAVKSHGTGVTAVLALSSLSITNCTNEWVVDVNTLETLEVHYKEVGSGHGVGTVTSTGSRFTMTRAGLSCVYETNSTRLGALQGGNPATLEIEASIPRIGGSFLCGGSTSALTGNLVTTHTLKIDP